MKYLGLDMGTSRIRLISASGLTLVNEPSCLVSGPSGSAAWGEQVNDWLQSQPGSAQTKVIYPFAKGSIQNYQATVDLIKLALKRSRKVWLKKPNVIATISASSSNSERQAFVQALNAAGFKHCDLVPASVASLLGTQLPLNQPRAIGLIQFGAGSSEVLVTCYGNLTALKSTTLTSGSLLERSLASWAYKKYRLRLPSHAIASTLHTTDALASKPRRQHKISSNGGKQIIISAEEIAPVIKEGLRPLVKLISDTLGNLPTQALADIMQDGLWLSGGMAAMRHLPNYLKQQTNLPVNVIQAQNQSCLQGIKFIQSHFGEYNESLLADSVKKFLA